MCDSSFYPSFNPKSCHGTDTGAPHPPRTCFFVWFIRLIYTFLDRAIQYYQAKHLARRTVLWRSAHRYLSLWIIEYVLCFDALWAEFPEKKTQHEEKKYRRRKKGCEMLAQRENGEIRSENWKWDEEQVASNLLRVASARRRSKGMH